MGKAKRPKSVTVIAWIIIAVGGLHLLNAIGRGITEPSLRRSFGNLFRSGVPMGMSVIPVSALLWISIRGFIGVVSGIAILKGLNRGRLLYLCYMPIWIIILTSGSIMYGLKFRYLPLINIIAIAFYITALVFLTRPNASAFLKSRSSGE